MSEDLKHKSNSKNKTNLVSGEYTCPMHLHVESSEPGSCPDCGMDLVLKEDLSDMDKSHKGHHHDSHTLSHIPQGLSGKSHYACPMHPEVTSMEPGVCPKCHMALEKVKASSSKHGSEGSDHNPNIFKAKFWVSLALTIPTVVLSPTIQTWLGYDLSFYGSHFVPAILGIIIFIYGGMVFIRSAKGELLAKRPGMMTLISMAITVALVYSLLVTFSVVDGMDFWWELATLVTIMLLGHWIEMASIEKAQGALGELSKLLPDEAELVVDGESVVTVIGDINAGAVVRVRPGSSVPVDGVVVEGASKVDESMLTGESMAVAKAIGHKVTGGTVNLDGALLVEVTEVGSETTLSGIMKMVEEAQQSKSKTQMLADKAAFYLFYVSVGMAIVTVLGWTVVGASPGFILERVVTVLVVACPHALGLAIPLVTSISTTHAARNGLLVRERKALEVARNVDVVMFDKTGTLTLGRQGVVDVHTAPGIENSYLLGVAGALEKDSEHPIAKAVVSHVGSSKIKLAEIKDFTNLPGHGVRGISEGKHVYIGGPNLIKSLSVQLSEELSSLTSSYSKQGKTVIYVVRESEIIGVIALADVIRDESREAVSTLQAQGKRVAILTGDSEGVASWVANELGIKEYFAQVLPSDKADVIEQLQADGSNVMMVGDGVNDAPALAQADVGVAIGAGTDVAIESAGIVLASNDPRAISKVIRLSKATYRKMVQNLAWAAGYNVLALPLAAGITASLGFILSPAVGAVLMSLSTIIVAINAQLLRRLEL